MSSETSRIMKKRNTYWCVSRARRLRCETVVTPRATEERGERVPSASIMPELKRNTATLAHATTAAPASAAPDVVDQCITSTARTRFPSTAKLLATAPETTTTPSATAARALRRWWSVEFLGQSPPKRCDVMM